MLWYPHRAPRCFRDQSNITTCPLVEPHHRFKIVKYKYHQSCTEKRYWPHLRVHRLSRGGPVAVDTLQTGYPHAQDLSPPPWCQTPHRQGRAPVPPRVPVALGPLLVSENSGITMCPMAPGMPSTKRGLQCRHVSRGSKPASRYPGL
jgi:hypothetical protein